MKPSTQSWDWGRRNPQRTLILVLGAVLLAGMLTGCIMPLPDRASGIPRKDLNKATAGLLEPGTSTRQDVILTLGEPDAVSADERVLVYRREREALLWFVASTGGAAGGTVNEARFLRVEFDEHGIVQKRNLSSEFPVRSSPSKVVGKPTRLAAEEVQISARADWFPDFKFQGLKFPLSLRHGFLHLTQTRLYFLADQFGNSEPALCLPFEQIAQCQLGKGPASYISIQTRAGQNQSFMLWTERGGWVDNQTTKRAALLIQSKISGASSVDAGQKK